MEDPDEGNMNFSAVLEAKCIVTLILGIMTALLYTIFGPLVGATVVLIAGMSGLSLWWRVIAFWVWLVLFYEPRN